MDIPVIHSIESEKAVLGAMICDPERTIDAAAERLRPEDFFHPAYQTIFSCLVDMRNKLMPIDPSTVLQYLEDRKLSDLAGGAPILGELSAGVISMLTAPAHIETVRSKAAMRNVVDAMLKSIVDIVERQYEPDAAINDAESRIFQSVERPNEPSGVSVGDAVKDVYRRILEVSARKDGLMGYPTGFNNLDKATAGIEKGQFWIVGARPNVGKTNCALSWMWNQAEKGIPVAMISGDSPSRDMARRLLSMHSGISLTRIRQGDLSEEESIRLSHCGDRLEKLPIRFYHVPGLALNEIRALSRRAKRKHSTAIIYIDYVQVIGVSGSNSKLDEVQKASHAVKVLAGELDIPIVGLAQVGRGVEKENRCPGLSDLKESGQIEQDADFVGFIHRDRESDLPGAKYRSHGLFLPAKGRDIQADPIKIWISPATAHFTDQEPDYERVKTVPF